MKFLTHTLVLTAVVSSASAATEGSLVDEVKAADLAADAAVAAVTTPEALRALQSRLRTAWIDGLGGLPAEKTPLNAKTGPVVNCDGFTLRNVLFESQPGVYVTGHLALPDSPAFKPPYPCVMMPLGHSNEGILNRRYLAHLAMTARAGLAAFAWDPVSQGERRQSRPAFDYTDNCSTEHTRLGARGWLVGWNFARFRIWDAIRAVDYVLTRPEIDGARLGVMGTSGGGTMSAYMQALDDRIRVGFPNCYVSSIRAVVADRGCHDAEQFFFGQLSAGVNHAAILALGQPRVALATGSRWKDYFPHQGAVETFAVLTNLVTRLSPSSVLPCWHFSCDGPHGLPASTRAAQTDWMLHRLLGCPAPKPLAEYRALDPSPTEDRANTEPMAVNAADTFFTATHQVRDLPGFRSVYDLIADRARELKAARRPKSREELRQVVRRRAGIRPLEKLRAEGARPADFRTAFGWWYLKGPFGHTAENEAAILSMLGRSYVGTRAEELILKADAEVKANGGHPIPLKAKGWEAIVAAHAYAAEPQLFSRLDIAEPPPSWTEMVTDPDPRNDSFAVGVWGALEEYDWTDCLSPVAGAEFGTLSADDEGRVILHGAAGEWRTLPSPVPVRVVERAPDRLRLELTTADGPVAADWTVDGGEATLRLSAPKDRAMTRPLAYPPAWETRKGDVGIHPFGEGAAFPADDPAAPAGGRLVSPFRRGHGVSMAFYGTVRGADHLMSGVRGALYAQYVVSNALPRTAFVEWLPEEGRWGSDRELRFFRGGRLGAVAGDYRAWRERIGRVTTLVERAKRDPKLLAFPGTADFWVWDDNAQNRLYNWPQVKESAPRDVRRIAGEMKALGLDRVLWNGFDDETPEDCAFLTGLGYLCGTYDCFRDVYHRELAKYTDVRNFVRGARFMPFAEDVSCIRADGTIDTAWTIPDKQGKMHAMYGLCDMCGPELAKRLIEPDVRRIGYTARLMDVQAAEGPRPCFSPKHPCTLRQAQDAIREVHRYLSDDLSLVIGVEVGNENMVGTYAYSEGLTSKVGALHRWCWRMKDHALYGTEVPDGVEEGQHGRRYRVPLWQLVYHDCSVSYTYWGDTTLMYPATAPVKELFCALYGEPPIYSMNVRTWDELKHEVAASYRHATPVARETMFARMTDYERLDPDGRRQRTTFANGVRVTADFDRLEYVLEVPGRAPRRVSVRESRELSIGNAELAVTFRTEDGSFDVLDKRCGKTWKALRGGKPPIAVRFANVVDGRIRFGFEAPGVKAGDRLDGELALEGPELVVRLSGPTNAAMTSFDYPLPFEGDAGRGERGGFKVPRVLRYAFFRDRCELAP